MSADLTLPHVDGSGRGLDDGDCIHCGASGSLAGWECPVRLREALDAALDQVAALESGAARLREEERDALARQLRRLAGEVGHTDRHCVDAMRHGLLLAADVVETGPEAARNFRVHGRHVLRTEAP